MFIVLLETKNSDNEVLRLLKDAPGYVIHRGLYEGQRGRFREKGPYSELAEALDAYIDELKGFVKDCD